MSGDQDKTIKWLNSSPMFQMSLGSRELFHSNFLAWMFEKYPGSLEVLGLDPNKITKIQREKKNIDLVFEGGGKTIAILENKVKDIPRLQQLNGYSKKFKKAEKRILLTMVPPDFCLTEVDGKSWDEVLYKYLIDDIKTWKRKYALCLTKRDAEFIDEYCDMTLKISELMNEWLNTNNIHDGYWFKEREWKDLAKIKFDSTIKKLYAQVFEKEVNIKLAKSLPNVLLNPNDKNVKLKLWTYTALFNGKPAMTAHATNGEVDLIVQIQGHSYRRMISFAGSTVPKNTSAKVKEPDLMEQIEATDDFRWLFGKSKGEFWIKNWDIKGPYKSKMRSVFNSYAPGSIYQHLVISESASSDDMMGYDQVIDCLVSDMKYAWKLINDVEYTQRFKKQSSS